ncbi:DJ-1/PfpI family protein [Corynebacterium kefirresidentii]|uniref:DJ-1/PfpI family protein n=1 Tax=Corynebacterium kefirresidentii TaxID=1979527 RepID=UPI000A3B78F7|nr:DJ-1/PfpI family protein [Corynebacterium kefirresidentii]OUJ22161.1 glutamine amidotransferase [Corynebacterium kefirresidentii]
MKIIAIYATETMSDWEYAYLTTQVAEAEAQVPDRFKVLFVGESLEAVRSKGGIEVVPVLTLQDIQNRTDIAAFVVPGADTYFDGHEQLLETVNVLKENEVLLAAICGGTLALARAGVLDHCQHTSNAQGFLASVNYANTQGYKEDDVVFDGGVITASGLAPVSFTAAVLRAAGVYPDDVVDAWIQLHEQRTEAAFVEHMNKVQAWASSH